MGRDIKVGLDYFPVYHDFFFNKKNKALRRAHGPIGLLTYLNILCRVYDNGYYYRFDSLKELAQDIAEEIASEQLRKVAAQVTESIHYLVEHQILAEEFFKKDVLTGITMQEQYIKSMYKMKRKIKMDTYLLVDVLEVLEKIKENSEQIGFSSEQIGFSSEESTQSKSKRKSENKIHVIKRYGNTVPCIASCVTEPSLQEIEDEIKANGYSINAERFYEYYTRRGWRLSDGSEVLFRNMLKVWNNNGIDTARDKRVDNNGLAKSFDIEEFYKAALKRSAKIGEKG